MSTEQAPAPAPAPVPAAAAPETPLAKLTARLAEITAQAGYGEMWGVELSASDHAPTQVILQKFLRANSGDAAAAEKQLASALEWRKKVNPAALVAEAFDRKKFGDLGFVTTHKDEAGKETVITWNIYGSVKDNKATFGDVQEFIKWRAALMELSVQQLHLNDIKEPIAEGAGAADPHQMLQVHDYQSVSFFRMDPDVKAASKDTIQVFSMAYPELLAHKYFVNVPAIMGWMFGAMKLFLAPATLRKFHPMTSGTTLATELKGIVASLPKEYGGQGPSVKEGLTVTLKDVVVEKEEVPVEANEAPVVVVSDSNVPEEHKPEAHGIDDHKPTDFGLVEETKPAAVVAEAGAGKAEVEGEAEETKPATELAQVADKETAP
ncbi:Phosphatidylinositol transfer protein sfh5 [Tolypocladium ophioglossoides CBS 100239]|uniref:Phosphatidylinositol transfer protein SFH5 n=1 Tax=Tolypocladium ophioglossoides (strain CBS 100239) TaxID=1163406 RepID=A0A0L0NCS5_TOLOC|nr:Phosphatidylinositol transfer protein sfh5 [Tolypocladium ophioglossoides CBS 100239]